MGNCGELGFQGEIKWGVTTAAPSEILRKLFVLPGFMDADVCKAVNAAIAAAVLARWPELAFSIPHLNSLRPTTPINRPIAVTYA